MANLREPELVEALKGPVSTACRKGRHDWWLNSAVHGCTGYLPTGELFPRGLNNLDCQCPCHKEKQP